MRFGGEAPGRRAHSHLGMEAMQVRGSPPPRTVVSDYRARAAGRRNSVCLLLADAGQVAGRSMTPCGTSPMVTMRHKAMSSFLARATIMVVLREHKRAKTDRLDTAMLMRVFLGWLRGERGHCGMVAVPSTEEEDA